VSDNDFNLELLFKALADRTRLRLIHLLGDDEVCVCSFVETLKTSQPKVSRHLAYLRRAGLVATRRDGKWTHYRLVEPSDPCAAKIFREVREWSAADAEMQSDKERLRDVRVVTRIKRIMTESGPNQTRIRG
jgi:ArsR family transcriptional regulator